jgi:hypothetical protein
MLDAYIIQRIREEREADSPGVPLHIEIPMEPDRAGEETEQGRDDDTEDRGVIIVDYSV